jgi:large subunit ribosomal protein L35
MPKLKTKKGVSKRMKLTKSGKIKRHHAGMGHLLSAKSSKRRRQLRQGCLVAKDQFKTYLRALGEA